jgi:hypothetical protein
VSERKGAALVGSAQMRESTPIVRGTRRSSVLECFVLKIEDGQLPAEEEAVKEVRAAAKQG